MLPNEPQAVLVLRKQIRREIETSSRVLGLAIELLSGTALSGKVRGQSDLSKLTILGALSKMLKTYRSIEWLLAGGLHQDASTLLRSLYETAAIVDFVLRKSSHKRAAMYAGYVAEQKLKMLKGMKETTGLKRQATKARIKGAEHERDAFYKQHRANVKRHWSGEGSLREATQTVLTNHGKAYESMYRILSQPAHGTDLDRHIEILEDGRILMKIVPGGAHEAVGLFYVASTILAETLFLIGKKLPVGDDARRAAIRVALGELRTLHHESAQALQSE